MKILNKKNIAVHVIKCVLFYDCVSSIGSGTI